MSSPDVRVMGTQRGEVFLKIDHEEPCLHIATAMPAVALRLLPRSSESKPMSLVRVLIAVLFFATLFAGSNMWTRVAAHRNIVVIQPPPIGDTTSVLDGRRRALHGSREDWAEPRIDLNGNEIDDAVGDYRVDRQGELYERHAPDTALLHLSAPRL